MKFLLTSVLSVFLFSCVATNNAFILGTDAYAAGNYAQAKKHLVKCSRDPYCNYLLGDIYYREGDYNNAAKYFIASAKQGKKEAQLSSALSIYMAYSQEDTAKGPHIKLDDAIAWYWIASKNGNEKQSLYNDLLLVYANELDIEVTQVPALLAPKLAEYEKKYL